MTIRGLAFGFVLAGILAPQPSPPAAAPFHLEARHMGYSLRDGWELTLEGSGSGTLTLWAPPRLSDGSPRKVAVSVSAIALRQLRDAVASATFFRLRSSYGSLPVDYPYRTIDIRAGNRSHSVSINTLWLEEFPREQTHEIKGLINLWATIRGLLNVTDAADARTEDARFLSQLLKKGV